MVVGSLAACIVIATAGTAHASDGESGWRYGSQCNVGSETRPAVTWRASKVVEVTPPGATYTLVYGTSGTGYRTSTNGGLMQGGYWEVYTRSATWFSPAPSAAAPPP